MHLRLLISVCVFFVSFVRVRSMVFSVCVLVYINIYKCMYVWCVCVCVASGGAQGSAEERWRAWRGVINKCTLMSEAAAMRGPCCYLLHCLCTAANPRPANGITACDEWALG